MNAQIDMPFIVRTAALSVLPIPKRYTAPVDNIRAQIEADIAHEDKICARNAYFARLRHAVDGTDRPKSNASRPVTVATSILPGSLDQPATISGGYLHRIGDADESEYAEPDETASVQFQKAVDDAFMLVCSDETGETEEPQQTTKREARERKLRAQGAIVCGGLIAAGKSAYRAEGWKIFALDIHERTLDEQPAFRRICLNPWIAHRLRLPYLNWLEYWLQTHPFARFWTFTSGERCRVEDLAARVITLHRKVSSLNAQRFMKEAGARIVLRCTEFGTVEKTNRKKSRSDDIQGFIEKDAGGAWYHPHSHCVVDLQRKLPDWEWRGLLDKVWKFWGNNWDEGKRIKNPRECVKYIVKPGDIVRLAEDDPAELGRLHDALFKKKLLQPMGSLSREMRAANRAGLVPALRWKNDKRKWTLIRDPNKNPASCGSDNSGMKSVTGEQMTVTTAERFMTLDHYGVSRMVAEIPLCRVVARCCPAFNSRGVKSPRVIVMASPGIGRAEVVEQAMRHPLVMRLIAATRENYLVGLAAAKAERGELKLTGGTRGNAQRPDIRVHTGTPTVLGGAPPGPENHAPPCFSDFEPSFGGNWS